MASWIAPHSQPNRCCIVTHTILVYQTHTRPCSSLCNIPAKPRPGNISKVSARGRDKQSELTIKDQVHSTGEDIGDFPLLPFSPQIFTSTTTLLSTGMLLIDIVSVLPFWIMEINPDVFLSGTLLRVPRLLRLAKLTKLLRGWWI